MSAHEHIYATCVGGDPHADLFPAQARRRVTAWSAHGAGGVEVEANERRFVDDELGVDETVGAMRRAQLRPRDVAHARKCAAMIHQYWMARGHAIDLDVDQHGVVTSDMRSGYPRRWAASE